MPSIIWPVIYFQIQPLQIGRKLSISTKPLKRYLASQHVIKNIQLYLYYVDFILYIYLYTAYNLCLQSIYTHVHLQNVFWYPSSEEILAIQDEYISKLSLIMADNLKDFWQFRKINISNVSLTIVDNLKHFQPFKLRNCQKFLQPWWIFNTNVAIYGEENSKFIQLWWII